MAVPILTRFIATAYNTYLFKLEIGVERGMGSQRFILYPDNRTLNNSWEYRHWGNQVVIESHG